MAGKYRAPKKRHVAPFVVILAVAALVATIGGSMAWLTDKSDKNLVNTFTPADVKVAVDENFKNDVKDRIEVKNIGDADVYVRVALVNNWVNGNSICADASHKHDVELSFELGNDWVEIDGYYYYKKVVIPGSNTSDLLADSATITLSETATCQQQVTVLAQAIQADGVLKEGSTETPAVETVWPVQVTENGVLKAK